MKKTIKSAIIIAFIILMSSKVYATTGKITSDNVRIRKEANTESEILTLVSIGDEVEVLETEEDWTKVKKSEFTGYIRNDMLEVQDSSDSTETTENNENTENIENKEEQANSEANTENNTNTTTEAIEVQEEKIKKDSTYTITTKLDLKIVPSINSSIVANISENTELQVKDIINKWCYVENGTSCGWVLKSKIEANIKNDTTEVKTETEQNNENTEEAKDNNEEKEETVKEEKKEEPKQEEKETNLTKYVSVSTLNLRKEANNKSEVIDQLDLNTKVTVTAIVDNKWAKINYNGKTGYVSNKYLSDNKTVVTSRSENINRENANSSETQNNKTESTEKETPAPSKTTSEGSSSSTGSAVVAYAKQFLGCKYVYGGMSPSGFDCSGFTSYVYKHFGYSLNRTSSGQRSNGVAVSKSNLQAGDILCFNGHVGLYIGGGSFIHAANPSKGVIISSLSESYYAKNYITARRIL